MAPWMASLPAVAPAPKMAALPNFLPAFLSHSPCCVGEEGGGSQRLFVCFGLVGLVWFLGDVDVGMDVEGRCRVLVIVPLGAGDGRGGWGLSGRVLVSITCERGARVYFTFGLLGHLSFFFAVGHFYELRFCVFVCLVW